MPQGNFTALRWLWISSLVIFLDQFSKYGISAAFSLHEHYPITSWFSLVLLHNTGAAFSFLSSETGWQRWFFVSIAVFISLILVIWIKRTTPREVLLPCAIALVLGGSVGNLIDRIVHGYVIDFILVHYKHWYFPAFNLADAAITTGAVFIALHTLFPRKQSIQKNR